MLGRIAKQLRVATRGSEVTWRYGYHLLDVMRYRLANAELPAPETQRVLDELNRYGVAKTSVDALLGSDTIFAELTAEVDALQRKRASELERVRTRGNEGAHKTYNFEFSDGHPKDGCVMTRFARQPEFKQIADRYLGLGSRLRGANAWLTMISDQEARQSQTWHRDPEDRYVVKIFALLSDVDEHAGPFQYARGSHMKSQDPSVKSFARYGLSDEEMGTLVPKDRWFLGTGPVGTVIIADTRGYHKGGLARKRERLVFVGMYLAY